MDQTFRDAVDFEVYQNYPNPFRDITAIPFTMPERGDAAIKVFDQSGKALRVIKGQYEQGYNEVKMIRTGLPSNGMIYYSVETKHGKVVRKMMLIE